MTSVRLAYILVVVFAATLYASGVAVSAMENSDTALIEDTVFTDAGLDLNAQRRLRGAVKQDAADEERTPFFSPALEKASSTSLFKRFIEQIKLMKEIYAKQPKDKNFFRKLMNVIIAMFKGKGSKTNEPK